MSNENPVVRLMLIDDSIEDAEHSISQLRNGGIAVRPSRPESIEELEESLAGSVPDLILASFRAKTISFATVTERVTASGKDVGIIALIDEPDEKILIDVLNSGACNFALRGRSTHLPLVVLREADNQHRRRTVRRLEAALRETERRCDALISSSRDPIAYVHEGMHIRANDAYMEMFGYESFEEIEGLPLLDMVGTDDMDRFKQILRDLSRGEAPPKNVELNARRSDGETFEALMQFTQARVEGEPCIQIVIRPQLVDAEMIRELDDLRQRDQATGLFNRQHFLSELDAVIAAAAEGASDHALLLLELDNHTTLLNEIGLASADDLLQSIADRIRSLLPGNAIAARFTGHGFTILLHGNHLQTRELAENLTQAFERTILEVGDRSLNTTLSVGGVQIGQTIASAQQVLNKVTSKLTDAQAEGGNRYLIFDPSARDRAEEARIAQWVKHMEEALQGEGFVQYFQPIVNLVGEPKESYQVLLRLTGPGGDIVTPSVFLGIAEEHGLMPKIDRWVIQRAIVAIAKRQRAGHDTRLFVKISTQSLQDPQFASWILANIQQVGIPGGNLVLCIPESKVFTNLKAAQDLYQAISSAGCGLCLEQFGLGLNSFQLLNHVSADYLSIDHSLIEDLGGNAESQEKIREITQKAAELQRTTIAEGVQDAPSMTILFTAGIHYVWGHFLAAPGTEMNFDFAGE